MQAKRVKANWTSTTLAFHARNREQEDTCVNVTVCESVHEPPASHLWPSAIVLARLVWHWRNRIKASGTVIELGCGTGLPGLLVSRLGLGKHVVLTDQSQASLDLVRKSIRRNGLKDVSTACLEWGEFDALNGLLDSLADPVGLILCADVFYDRSCFDALVGVIAVILNREKRKRGGEVPRCLLAYHERSSRRCIQHLLDKWGLAATTIESRSFGFVDGRVGPGVCMDELGFYEGITVGSIEEGEETGSGWGTGMGSVFVCCIQLASIE
ncbi:hypothetical protein HDU78_002053 [Chytriomyces hyalinus]|nr:hypothetical protein HDU78_002053 [Chytriomyces hyalinus]